ncbi:MAG: transporter [Denitrovibrio sp.]|nr:MAG: transporter [Denitrovibrio sp.]
MNSLIILSALFSAALVVASILSSKIITIFGFFVPAGIIAYSITFIITDTTSEIYGKKAADTVVLSGFISLVVTFLMMQASIILPSAPFWTNQEAFVSVIGSTSRIIIASLVAYVISQFHDVWLFHFLKQKTNGKHLWLRNNASTAISQFIDSFIFISIAFYGVMPIWQLIFGQWVIKMAIALIDTPIVYLLVGTLRKKANSLVTA